MESVIATIPLDLQLLVQSMLLSSSTVWVPFPVLPLSSNLLLTLIRVVSWDDLDLLWPLTDSSTS